MTAGALAPDPPCLANPSAQHLWTEIAMKPACRRTVSAAQPGDRTSMR